MIIVGLMVLFNNSWRAVFLVMGALGILWIALWWYATRDASALESDDVAAGEEAPKADAATRVSLGDQILQMVSHPGFWVLVVISMTINPCFYFLADWVPKYLIDVREFSLEGTGLLVTPIMIGGLIGNFIGGAVMKYLSTRGWAVIARGISRRR